MRSKRRFVYTNIGLNAEQHRLLKHLAVEERKDMAALVREAIDVYLGAKQRARAIAYEDNFVFKMGRGRTPKPERPYRPQDWSQADRDVYGLDRSPHGA